MNCLRSYRELRSMSGVFARVSLLTLFLMVVPTMAAETRWGVLGPSGGDARAFAAVPGQPHHLYLGSTDSWLYESKDGGGSWLRLAKLDAADDLILDHIVVDPANPSTLFVAAWKLDHPGGGLWVSRDAGRNWSAVEGLRGQSIRAFAQAPSNPSMLFAGTLEGVFQSMDSGATWKQISPPGSHEIHEVESLAIDPSDPDVVYAGTWHLPWKTTDGGKNWLSIKRGVIDDSDVFSIIIDPTRPKIVYASACSGIYKSENAAELFKKIEGIPLTARRTRVLKQDPEQPDVVYAGTTEGLYKTMDGGKSFKLMTGPDVIVNDVFVDPDNSTRLLVATDRGGVLQSTDGGASFAQMNEGFSGRKVEALLVENMSPAAGDPAGDAPALGRTARMFAGVVNDKANGGVFVSADGGARWKQVSEGLDGRDVFALAESPEGTIVAGTNHGIFALEADAAGARWIPRNTIENTLVKTATETHGGTRVNVEKHIKDKVREIESRVSALDLSGVVWLAATAGSLFTSKDHGTSWQGGPVIGKGDYLSIAAHGKLLAAARQDGVVLSKDGGESWMPMGIPLMLTRIHCVAFSDDGTLWLGTREGVYFTHDLGKKWLWVNRFPLNDVDDLTYDSHLNRILVSSHSSDQIYVIKPKSLEWTWAQTGYRINRVRSVGGKLIAASLFDGVVAEP
jgi:photosystem II stability/assembly factor-like uncharacterized protein